MAKNTTTKKRGRPALTPKHVEAIAAAPQGQPVVVKAAKSYSLAHHHKKCLLAAGVADVTIISPKAEREVGTGVVSNIGTSYAVAAPATGAKQGRRVHKMIVVV